MSAVAKRSIILLGMLILIVVATLWAWAGTAQGASLDVTKTVDTDDGACDADCSLREAILYSVAGDTINIPTGDYTLTMGIELTIGTDLTLNGAGSGATIIQADTDPGVADFRVFNITGGTVAISDVTIQNGDIVGNGGGLLNEAILTLNSSIVSDNAASSSGGGIYNTGTLTLADSWVGGNSALFGGGIFNVIGILTLSNTIITGNVTGATGGGLHNDSGGTLTLTNSTVSGNTSNSIGGGILNDAGTMVATNSTITSNTANVDGGSIYNGPTGIVTLINTTVSDNTATTSNGGGIYNLGTLTLTDSDVSGNTASSNNGGGILNSGTLNLTDSAVSGNTSALAGGGIWNDTTGTLNINNTTIGGNTANDGGGIYNFSGTQTLTNITVSGNTASASGGGIYNNNDTMTLTNSTVTDNVAETGSGGGIRNIGTFAELVNTIIAVNSAASLGPDCFGAPISLGYNLIGDDTDCGYIAATGDLLNVDPLLGPLQDNGGPTFTHALLTGSPAIDAIPVADCNDIDGVPVTTDQRGVVRPQGPDCDMGSYELEPVIEATSFRALLTGEEALSAVETNAKGRFRARLNEAGTELEYQILVSRIRGVTAAHIHCAPFGEAGAVGVTLFDGGPVDIRNGTLAAGSLAGPDLGNGCGWTTFDDMTVGLRSGDTYVNVHTETWPGGEIRGQIEPLLP